MTNNILILYPLILTFSLREKGLMVFPDGHYLVLARIFHHRVTEGTELFELIRGF